MTMKALYSRTYVVDGGETMSFFSLQWTYDLTTAEAERVQDLARDEACILDNGKRVQRV